jgi:TPR repeat protein
VTPAPASTALSPVGPYYALVIGNNNYQHLNKLQTAVNDADSVARVLREDYGFSVTILRDANRQAIVTALNDYRRTLNPDSSLLIYYAGHGFHDREAEEIYWLPVTAVRDNNVDWISGADITSNIRAIPSRHILIISDSCYSGALSRDMSGGIDPLQRGAYLSKMLSSKSRHWMSSGSDEPVLDNGPGGHSVFAAALLESMKREDDQFTAADLFQRFIQPRVGGGSAQTPQYTFIRNSGHDYGDFVFIRSKNTASVSSGITAGDMVNEAKKYYKAKQYDRALPLFRSAAEAANAEAAGFLGLMYDHGLGGLPKDDAQAVSLYRKAADAGDTQGMAYLGIMFRDGRGGLTQDYFQAVSWIRKAAEAGDATGMRFLAFMYESGRGVPKDDTQAVSWFRKAAEAGDTFGMQSLARMYKNGLGGLPKDDTQAVSWYRKAAEAGDTWAMSFMGWMYENGQYGLAKDEVQAVSWYRKAAEAGDGNGMADLGNMYRDGKGGLPKDRAQAPVLVSERGRPGEPNCQGSTRAIGEYRPEMSNCA